MGTALKAVVSEAARRNRSKAAGDNAEPPATAVTLDDSLDELERRAAEVMLDDAPENIDKAREKFDFITTNRDGLSIEISVADTSEGFFNQPKAIFQRVVFAPRGGLAELALIVAAACDRLDPPRTLSECPPLVLQNASPRGQCGATRSGRGCCAGRVVRSNGRAHEAAAE